jgi:aerobic-type carbon monoxide dehydrogenase small subunit (CoxS/CutS family)
MTLNRRPLEVTVSARTTLAGVLRDHLHLFGTKLGCNEGTCGSCTVQVDGVPVYACMLLASDAARKSVLTIEGLGTPDKPHPLQRAFADTYAAQCGYCTPGLILTAEALLRRTPQPSEAEVKNALSGHLCKCAAYPEIVLAVMQAAKQQARPPGETTPH